MSIPGSAAPFLLARPPVVAPTAYEVQRSLRFNSSDSAYLSRTPSSAGNRKTWTWAGWVKRSNLTDQQAFWSAGSTGTNRTSVLFDGSARIRFFNYAGSVDVDLVTTPVYRDASAWYHVVISVDTTQGTSTNRLKLYINGAQVTTFSTATYPSLNQDLVFNSAIAHGIGRGEQSGGEYFNGYLADVHLIDGQALDPSSFTEVSATTGQLIPKAYTGSFGTNGFWLKFSDNSAATATTLGKDYSGNSNNWTPNNFSVLSSYTDTFLSRKPDGTSWTNPTYAFDGTTANYADGTYNNGTVSTIRFNKPLTGVTLLEYFYDGTSTYGYNSTDVGTGPNLTGGSWVTVYSGSAITVNNVRCTSQPGNGVIRLYAIRVNGTILNNWTETDPPGCDSTVDTPTSYGTDTGAGGEVRGNYCTLNPLFLPAGGTLSNGNLDATLVGATGTDNRDWATGSILNSSGKWYYEVVATSYSGGTGVERIRPGIVNPSVIAKDFRFGTVLYRGEGSILDNNVEVATGLPVLTVGDVVGIAYDLDALMFYVYINGILKGSASIANVPVPFAPIVGNSDAFTGTGNVSVNFGQRPFAYDISTTISEATGAKPILNTSDSYGQTLSSGTATDANSGSIALAIPMNGVNNGATFTDQSATIRGSGSAVTITRNGAVTSTVSSRLYGSSGRFEATGNSGNGTNLALGSLSGSSISSFTFEAWFRVDSQAQHGFFSNQAVDNAANTLRIGTNSSSQIWMKIGSSSFTGGSVTTNAWNHIAVCRSGSTSTIYLNGTSIGTLTESASINATGFEVGRTYSSYGGASNFGLTGYLQDVRFYTTAKYTANFIPPSDGLYKALCDTNLPAPVVAKPSEVMDVKLYTGNGSTQTISGLGFSPDLVWVKARVGTRNHVLSDTIRGTNNVLASNTTAAQVSPAVNGQISAFNSDGFAVAAGTSDALETNNLNDTYVAWTWDAGSSTVTNTQGSITSQVRANASAGFSVVGWNYPSGTGASTIGHGLGVKPGMIILKNRDTSGNWIIYHSGIGATKTFRFTTAAASTESDPWNNTEPTSTVFSIGAASWHGSGNIIAYCFAPVASYSAFGSYTGNGSTDGPFIYTGFRPKFFMLKSSTSAENWLLIDAARPNYNAINQYLFPNSSSAEGSAVVVADFTSNGVKIRYQFADVNTSGATYIYAAFAESPFQFSRAR